MLLQPTLEKMHEMKLSPMAEAFSRQIQEPQFSTLAFEERVGMMIDAEYSARQERKITRRLQVAKLRQAASLEDIDWQSPRGLDRQQVLSLGTCGFIRDHQNLLITGATGVGKSWLACAFAQRACRSGFWAYYQRASRLFHDTSIARADGSYGRLLAKLAKMDLLVIDDFALSPLEGRRTARPSGNPRGPPRARLHLHHQPAPHQGLARRHRRRDPGRRHL